MSSPGRIRIARRRRIPGGASTGASGYSDDGATTTDGVGKIGAIWISIIEVVGDTCLLSISLYDFESSEHIKGKTNGKSGTRGKTTETDPTSGVTIGSAGTIGTSWITGIIAGITPKRITHGA
ncbi:hypothetical protein Tco_0960617 [Tanacetum coccineum]